MLHSTLLDILGFNTRKIVNILIPGEVYKSVLTPQVHGGLVRAGEVYQLPLVRDEPPLGDHDVKVWDDDGPLVHQVNQVRGVVTIWNTIKLEGE